MNFKWKKKLVWSCLATIFLWASEHYWFLSCKILEAKLILLNNTLWWKNWKTSCMWSSVVYILPKTLHLRTFFLKMKIVNWMLLYQGWTKWLDNTLSIFFIYCGQEAIFGLGYLKPILKSFEPYPIKILLHHSPYRMAFKL